MKGWVQIVKDRATDQEVTILEKLDGGLFLVQFVTTTGRKIADALAGEKALRRWSELQREETQENPLQKIKKVHRQFDSWMRSLSGALYDSGLSANASAFSGRPATVSDLGGHRLTKLYKKILGTNRYDGLIKEPSDIDREHKQAYREFHRLSENEDEIIHFNRQAAASFVQMVKDLPDLAATRFIEAFFDLARNGWIREGGSYSNESIRWSDAFEAWMLLLADRMERSRPQRDDTAIIRSEFLSSIGMRGSRNEVPSGALWIGQERAKKISDMIIWEEWYTTPWSLDRVDGDCELSCAGGGAYEIKLSKTASNELMVVWVAQGDFGFRYHHDREGAVAVGQIIRIR